MDRARQLAEFGFRDVVVRADVQRRGRGRLGGRSWLSDRGDSLLVTLVLGPASSGLAGDSGPVSIRVGLALAGWLDQLGVSARIKWPNDLLVRERKIAGVLVERSDRWCLVGIGLNVRQFRFEAASLRNDATSVFLETGALFEPSELVAPLLNALHRELSIWPGSSDWRRRLLSRLWPANRRAHHSALGSVEILSVMPDGSLLVLTLEGKRSISSGSLSRSAVGASDA